jgi:hypothetical protein
MPLLSLDQAQLAISLWDEKRQSYNLVIEYLSPNQAFRLSKEDYMSHIESSDSETVHAYLGIDSEGTLILIWVPGDFRDSKSEEEPTFVYSTLESMAEPSYLVDTIVEVKTHVIEIESDLSFSSSNSFSQKDYLGSDNALPSSEAYIRINSWSKSYLDWAYMTLQSDREIVRVFSVPMNDLQGLFGIAAPPLPGVNMIKIFMGLYFSPIAGFEIPDLILAGDRTNPTGIVELPGTKKYNEATDLIRPCPPFCNDGYFVF